MWVCLKTEELRWGSPTATPPFATLDLAPKEVDRYFCSSLSLMVSSASSLTIPEKSPGPWACRRGPSQTVYLYRRSRIRLWKICLPSVAYSYSAYFRVFPCSSVANASAWSFFRGKCFCLWFRYPQIWAIPSFHINQNRRNGRNVLFFLLAPSFYLIIFVDVVLCFIWCLLCTDNPLDS